jgi:hypothetical protein
MVSVEACPNPCTTVLVGRSSRPTIVARSGGQPLWRVSGSPLCAFRFRRGQKKRKAQSGDPRRTRAPSSATVSKVKVLARPVWRPVTEGNCVPKRGGGEQPKVNSQSVASANSIRPATLASLRVTGEAQMVSARGGSCPDSPTGRVAGGWRRNGTTIRCREEGRPVGDSPRSPGPRGP